MSKYEGLELIDPIEREKQHALTKALWQQLCEAGIKTRDKGRINCFMVSKSFEMANKLKLEYQGDWECNIFKEEESSQYLIKITTSLCYLSIEAFIELADILMYAGLWSDSTFDGFEIDIEEVKKLNKPWWKLW